MFAKENPTGFLPMPKTLVAGLPLTTLNMAAPESMPRFLVVTTMPHAPIVTQATSATAARATAGPVTLAAHPPISATHVSGSSVCVWLRVYTLLLTHTTWNQPTL